MKKLLSILLSFAMIFGAFCAFPVSAYDDTPYSGGSGTEEDPYLISSADDIRELKNNIVKDPSLWYTKYYYRLTNDIETYTQISPLYTGLGVVGNIINHSLVEVSGDVNSRLAVYSLTTYMDIRYDYYYGPCIEPESTYKNLYYYGEGAWGMEVVEREVYRSAAFTGVFDGNGFTIDYKGSNSLFGFIENGAVIKNLNVKSNNANFAFCIDSSTIESCSLNSKKASWAVTYNLGTVTDFVNYSENATEICKNSKGPEDYGSGSKTNTVNYASSSISEKADGNYAYEDCISANGNESYFEGLDFDSVWVMMDGMPTLRSACQKGDTNFDGYVNGKDANLLQRFVVAAVADFTESDLIISDVNGDGIINAKDINGLKRKIAG